MKAIELLNSRASVLLLETNSTKNIQRMYLEKSLTPEGKEQYFIKIYSLKSGCLECLGYIYFYIDYISKTSSYVGTFVKTEFRSLGLSSLLTSMWIKLCLEEGLEILNTSKKQCKPSYSIS